MRSRFKASNEQLEDELTILKDSIKKSQVEEVQKNNLSEAKRIVKSTEKENHKLKKRLENFLENEKLAMETLSRLLKSKLELTRKCLKRE